MVEARDGQVRDGQTGDGRWRELPTPEATAALGEDLATRLRAGDVVLLYGELVAGKTTLTQGIGRALAVRGAVTSPTFVIARSHRGPGITMVHVDAYRLGGTLELDDLDLDADLDAAVTVVEWGAGLAERQSGDRLEVRIGRARGDAADAGRDVEILGVGPRWDGVDLAHLALDEREGRA